MRGGFTDRAEAGRMLAEALAEYGGREEVLVLGLPRGGVAVAVEVARHLRAPLDVLIVRKLGVPWHPELGFGALASGEIVVLNWDVVRDLELRDGEVETVIARERAEAARREEAYRGHRPFPNLQDQTVILVDDGLATGGTMRAAIAAVQAQGPTRLVVAVPVAPGSTVRHLAAEVDQVVCLLAPDHFQAIGLYYDDFRQLDDAEVQELLASARPATLVGERGSPLQPEPRPKPGEAGTAGRKSSRASAISRHGRTEPG